MCKHTTADKQRKWHDSAHASLCILGSYLCAMAFFRLSCSAGTNYRRPRGAAEADGRDIYFNMSAAPVRSPTEEVTMAVAVVRDVTELKRLERLRDEFFSTAAHELKTPVATIKGYAQMLSRRESHEPREAAAFAVMNRQCDCIDRLVQELLEVSRLRLGHLELHKQRFELGELAAYFSLPLAGKLGGDRRAQGGVGSRRRRPAGDG